MPFRQEMRPVYFKAISPACRDADWNSLRVDELRGGSFSIHRRIIEYIFNSDAIIADLTDHNPNVFYEMGVAHAIANKTIMIRQKSEHERPPFDISSYRCFFYDQTVSGLEELRQELTDSLLRIDEWRHSPNNPVQDFKPYDAFILRDQLESVQRILDEKDRSFAKLQADLNAVNQTLTQKDMDIAKLQADLKAVNQTLTQKDMDIAKLQTDLETLKQTLAQKEQLIASIKAQGSQQKQQKTEPTLQAKPPDNKPSIQLRLKPLGSLSDDDVKRMIEEKGFFDSNKNKQGKGISHIYEVVEKGGQNLIVDRSTGLMWQQAGSQDYMNYADVKRYIKKLNDEGYAGFNDWRLPTLEEFMSLMEPTQKNKGLYIDPLFDSNQRWIWTADMENSSFAWIVVFTNGCCSNSYVDSYHLVRGVR
jgi:hypothetical protein